MMNPTLFTPLFSDPVIAQQFSTEQTLSYLILVEAALAQVQDQLGIIPAGSATAIVTGCMAVELDIESISHSMEQSGVPTIELVNHLRQKVDPAYAAYVHWGATSQDIMDTALMLQLRASMEHIEAILRELIHALAQRADVHRYTLMAGRTHSQQALPITFGFKVAGWLAPLLRHRQRLCELKKRLLVVQFGGAVGTLASLHTEGLAVQEALAEKLELGISTMPWHTQRDTLVELASWLSMVTGSLGKMAQDIILMAQSEIAEIRESKDLERGGSSTMPQKQNPITSELIIMAARTNASLLSTMHQAMIQEHERATGSWQMEWLSLPQMLNLSAAALGKALTLSRNMVVDADKMAENVRASNGLMMAEALSLALAPFIGRNRAKQEIKAAVKIAQEHNRHLVDVLQGQLNIDIDWNAYRDESTYLGMSNEFIDRVLQEIRTEETVRT